MTADQGDYDRGHAAGRIDQRLSEHERRLDGFSTSIAENTTELARLVLAVQRLDDRMRANLETVATTAGAVEKEREATATAVEKVRTTARDASEHRWSPVARMLAILTVIIIAAALAFSIYGATHK